MTSKSIFKQGKSRSLKTSWPRKLKDAKSLSITSIRKFKNFKFKENKISIQKGAKDRK